MIRYGNTVLGEFFEKHLQQIIESYIKYRSAVDEQFRKWLDLSSRISDPAALYKLDPFKSIFDMFTPRTERPEGEGKSKKEGGGNEN